MSPPPVTPAPPSPPMQPRSSDHRRPPVDRSHRRVLPAAPSALHGNSSVGNTSLAFAQYDPAAEGT